MAHPEKPSLPQPPWVWGPSEVGEWIRAAYPAKRRRRRGEREGPEIIARLRVGVQEADVRALHAAFSAALEEVGVAPRGPGFGGRPKVSKHVAVVSVHRSLLRTTTWVSARFLPPIHVSSCRRIVTRLSREFRVVRVSLKEERASLPRRTG